MLDGPIAESSNPIVLITGISGGLGAELLPRVLTGYSQHDIVGLIRGKSDAVVADRLSDLLDFGDIPEKQRRRVTAIRADVCARYLGLPDSVWHELADRTSAVFHLAANVNFSSSLEDSRLVNVTGTKRVIEFCHACVKTSGANFRLNHVSTAYVSGKRRGLLKEHELHEGQGFWNAYEQSKYEAEKLVSACRSNVPTTIFRPSQVIGDSLSGRVRKYFGLYEFLQIAHRGKIRQLPANSSARQDMVPVDYVCDGMVYLSQQPYTAGNTYYLAAGLNQSISVGQAVKLIHQAYYADNRDRKQIPIPEIIPLETHSPLQLKITRHKSKFGLLQMIMGAYRPYLSYERDFDVANTSVLLRNAGIPFPAIDQVLLKTAKYAINKNFGL